MESKFLFAFFTSKIITGHDKPPDIKIIPFNELPNVHIMGDIDSLCEDLRQDLINKRVDGVISGVGG